MLLPFQSKLCSLQSKLKFLSFACLGEISQIEEEQAFSISAKSVLAESETKTLYEEEQVQNASTLSKVTELKRSKRRLKQSGGEGNSVEFDLKAVTTKQKLSVKSVEVSGA